MERLFFLYFLFISLQNSSSASIALTEEPKVIAKVKADLTDILKCRNEREIVIINEGLDYEDLASWLTTKANTVQVINTLGIASVLQHLITDSSLYIFGFSDENQILDVIRTVNASCNYCTTYFIVMCGERRDTHLLANIWSKFRYLNCFMIRCKKSVRVSTYNPFLNRTITFKRKQIKDCSMFSDKMKDMNGYKLKIALFLDHPRVTKINGRFEGRNVRLMNLILEKLNATAEIIEPEKIERSYFAGANEALINGIVDASFMEHFSTISMTSDKSYSYPHSMDDFVVIVANAPENSDYFEVFDIFDYVSWICIAASFIAVAVYRACSAPRSNVAESALHAWCAFTGNSLNSMFKATKKVRLLFLCWLLCCLVLDMVFSSLLASKIIKPKLRKDIDTIEELANGHYKILISSKFAEEIPKKYGISRGLTAASHLERAKALQNIDEKTAVVVAASVVELIHDQSHLHVLKEHLLPGFGRFCYQYKSPFRQKIDDIIFTDVECGISRFNENFTIKDNRTVLDHNAKQLKFAHLKNIFVICLLGYGLAAVVFVIELLWSKTRKT